MASQKPVFKPYHQYQHGIMPTLYKLVAKGQTEPRVLPLYALQEGKNRDRIGIIGNSTEHQEKSSLKRLFLSLFEK